MCLVVLMKFGCGVVIVSVVLCSDRFLCFVLVLIWLVVEWKLLWLSLLSFGNGVLSGYCVKLW